MGHDGYDLDFGEDEGVWVSQWVWGRFPDGVRWISQGGRWNSRGSGVAFRWSATGEGRGVREEVCWHG